MERIIKVTGKAQISVTPDTFQLVILLKDIRETYNQSRALSIECTNELQRSLEELGFGHKELKTRSYAISAKYDSYQDSDKRWVEEFKGYEFSHRMVLEMPIDNILLGRVIEAVNSCSVSPNIEINYTVKDPTPAKNELLAKAVADSKIKASVMAQAAGVVLGDVLTIDYSWGEINITHRYDMDGAVGNCCDSSIDFTPEDIDLTDSVTVVWNIG